MYVAATIVNAVETTTSLLNKVASSLSLSFPEISPKFEPSKSPNRNAKSAGAATPTETKSALIEKHAAAAAAGFPTRAHATVENSAPPYLHHDTKTWNVATDANLLFNGKEEEEEVLLTSSVLSQYSSPSASAAAARTRDSNSPLAAYIHVADTTYAVTVSAASITATEVLDRPACSPRTSAGHAHHTATEPSAPTPRP